MDDSERLDRIIELLEQFEFGRYGALRVQVEASE